MLWTSTPALCPTLSFPPSCLLPLTCPWARGSQGWASQLGLRPAPHPLPRGVPAEPPYSYRDTQGHLGTIQLLGAGKTLGNTTRGLPGDSSVTLYIHHGGRQLYGSPWQPFSRAAHPDPSGPAAQLRDGAGRALGTWTFCRVTPLDLSGTLGTLTHAPTTPGESWPPGKDGVPS